VVERAEILGSHRVRKGDAIIGVGSSGFHSNGYSLIRKVLEDQQLDLRTCYEGTSSESQKSLGDLLLEPTRLYVKAIESVRPMGLHASAHITGGGLFENLPRVLPEGFGARVNPRAWNRLPLFDWICERGGIAHDEAYRVFNMGIGMALIVESEHAKGAVAALVADGYESWIIGHVQEGEGVVIEGS
jgi:phosphoribosylformylglycinamidine cyclo-ligase